MKRILAACLLLLALVARAQTISNSLYSLTLNSDHTVTVNVAGISAQTLTPEFTVMYSTIDPDIDENHDNFPLAPRSSILWKSLQEDATTLQNYLNLPAVQADLNSRVEIVEETGGRLWTWFQGQTTTVSAEVPKLEEGVRDYRYSGGTTNPFLTSTTMLKTVMTANGSSLSGDTITWTFSAGVQGTLTASLTLPGGSEDPRLTYTLTAVSNGWFSVAFTGTPAVPTSLARRLDQDTATRSFQLFNHVVAESTLHMPHVYVGTTSGWTTALMMDPVSVPPFDSTGQLRIPYKFESYFGAMLQKDYTAATLKPVLFAPLMGGLNSQLAPSNTVTATIRYLLRNADWKDVFAEQAQVVYGNGDVRDNSGPGSINGTIDRLVDFLDNANGRNFAMWHDEQKYYDYANDAPSAFKPFSPLFGLSLAVVTDNEHFYRTRARPQIEFALSRRNNLFAPYDLESDFKNLISGADRSLTPGPSPKPPYLGYAQSTTLHHFLQGRNHAPLFFKSANPDSFPEMLAKYSVTGSGTDLAAAQSIADADIAGNPLGSTYRYMDWLDLWEASGVTAATRDPDYLAKARERAYAEVMSTITLSPAIPSSTTTVVLDSSGRAPLHVQSAGRHTKWGFPAPLGYPTPGETVPVWRPTLNGLQGQAPYRGSYFVNLQPQFVRIGSVTDDPFLANVGRLAFIGRFGSYAGDFRAAPSRVAELTDLPENPLWRMTQSTFNPGHAWEFAAAVFDFLISDVYYRSLEAIDFPSRTMFGGGEAQFRVRLYGDRPGKFYGDSDVRLWMPKGLLRIDSKQIDYVAAYGNGKLYLALVNRASSALPITVYIDPDRADVGGSHAASSWIDNVAQSASTVIDNQFTLTIPAKGIAAYAISGVTIYRGLQQKMLSSGAPALGAPSVQQTPLTVSGYPGVTVTGMLLSLGQGLTHAYIYSDAHATNSATKQLVTRSARLEYRQGSGSWQELTDAIYPFEFSVDYVEGAGDFEYKYYVTAADGTESGWTSAVTLSAGSLPAQAPQAPSDLAARSDDAKAVLKWTATTGATTYKIKRATTSGGPYTTITSGATGETYTDTAVSNGTTYYYVVSAVNGAGESSDSGQVYVTPRPLPTAVTATTQPNGSVQLSWTAVSGATGYVIKRSEAGNGPYGDTFTVLESVSGTTYNDVPPTNNGGMYDYVVAALFGAAGESGNSATVSAIAEPTTVIVDDQDATGVTIVGAWTQSSSQNGQIFREFYRLSNGTTTPRSVKFTPTIPTAGLYKVYGWWSAAGSRANNAVYEIFSDSGTATLSVNQRLNGSRWTDLGDYNFAAGTTGSVTIRTDTTATGTIAADAIRLVYVSPPTGGVPGAPTGLTATAGNGQVALGWTGSSGASSYSVNRGVATGGPYTTVVSGLTGTSYTDTSVTNGTTYYYVTTAANASGTSGNSNEASATPIGGGTVTFTSVAAEDGWVQESNATSNVGGLIDSTSSSATAIKIGDNSSKKQWKGVFSFDTSGLPDGATIVSATLKMKRGNAFGSISALGTLYADIKNGGFNGSTTLETADFQASADATQVAAMSIPAANGDWSTGAVNASGLAAINKTGSTQFRAYFATGDNGNSSDDYLSFYSSENTTATNRPVVEITYTIP